MRPDIVPASVAPEYLQTFDLIRPQHGDQPEIGMFAHPLQLTVQRHRPFG